MLLLTKNLKLVRHPFPRANSFDIEGQFPQCDTTQGSAHPNDRGKCLQVLRVWHSVANALGLLLLDSQASGDRNLARPTHTVLSPTCRGAFPLDEGSAAVSIWLKWDCGSCLLLPRRAGSENLGWS